MTTTATPETVKVESPESSHAAAANLTALDRQVTERRRNALRFRSARDDAERLYRQQKHRALIDADGPNAEARAAECASTEVSSQVKADADAIARRLGFTEGFVPDTVDDLRWLRDRADGIADATTAAAYDARDLIRAWMVVASMAKSEADLGGVG